MSAISADVSKEQLDQLGREAEESWRLEHQEEDHSQY